MVAARAVRTRSWSSSAALLVNVSPRIAAGGTPRDSTSQTIRAAITAVLPEPAPAIRWDRPSGDLIAAHCSVVGSAPRSAARIAGLATTVWAPAAPLGAPPIQPLIGLLLRRRAWRRHRWTPPGSAPQRARGTPRPAARAGRSS